MTNLRTAFLATTAVGLMALATPAFAEVIMTPDGHYYKLVPLKAPPPGAASSVATLEDATSLGGLREIVRAPSANLQSLLHTTRSW